MLLTKYEWEIVLNDPLDEVFSETLLRNSLLRVCSTTRCKVVHHRPLGCDTCTSTREFPFSSGTGMPPFLPFFECLPSGEVQALLLEMGDKVA